MRVCLVNPTLEILRRGRVAIERRESIHYARHILGIADEHQAKAVLTKAAHELLTELASFPEKIRDPNWMQTL
jgi:hypothetical protein